MNSAPASSFSSAPPASSSPPSTSIPSSSPFHVFSSLDQFSEQLTDDYKALLHIAFTHLQQDLYDIHRRTVHENEQDFNAAIRLVEACQDRTYLSHKLMMQKMIDSYESLCNFAVQKKAVLSSSSEEVPPNWIHFKSTVSHRDDPVLPVASSSSSSPASSSSPLDTRISPVSSSSSVPDGLPTFSPVLNRTPMRTHSEMSTCPDAPMRRTKRARRAVRRP